MKTKTKPLPLFKTPPKTVQQLARRTIRLMRQGWTVRCLARTRGGSPCSYDSPRAYSVCVFGAMNRASFLYGSKVLKKLDQAMRKLHPSPAEFNNRQTSAAPVVEMVRKAAGL